MSSPEGFARPWVEFEEEFGLRPTLTGDLQNFEVDFLNIGNLMASKYTFAPPDPAVKSEDRIIDDGLKVRVYTPETYNEARTVGVYFHGGGWAMGDLESDDAIARTISKGGNVVVVSVEYRLAPQNKHPGLVNDCWSAFKWTLKNCAALGGLNGKVFLSGGSAGAGLALGTALRAIDEGLGDSVEGVVAVEPATVHPDAVPEDLKPKYRSYDEHDSHTINPASTMRVFWDAFGAPPTDIYASPLLHPRIKDLKRVYLVVAGQDTLRDDGLLFQQKLDEANVPNRLDLYEGYPHYHWIFPSSKLDKPREEFNANLARGVNYVLS